jgi:hypothetical protein
MMQLSKDEESMEFCKNAGFIIFLLELQKGCSFCSSLVLETVKALQESEVL